MENLDKGGGEFGFGKIFNFCGNIFFVSYMMERIFYLFKEESESMY